MSPKISLEVVEAVLVVPVWPTQSWFPKLMSMLIAVPLLLPKNVIYLPFNKATVHKQHKNLHLLACHISGTVSDAKEFRRSLSELCLLPGENPPSFNMKYILKSGYISVVRNKLIPYTIMK